jgi:PAS domain S-box-containing protein
MDNTECGKAEAEAQDVYEGLEAVVAERTFALEAANDRLREEIETRKEAEEALRESELRFRSLFERHRATMLLIDPDSGAILDVNAAAEQFYGFSRAELCAMNISEINQLSGAQIAEACQRIVKREIHGFVFPHRLRSGEIRTVEVYSSPVEMGGRTVLFSIVHDITERKRAEDKLAQMNESLQASHAQLQKEIAFRLEAEEALKESRQKLANIIDFLPDATFVIDDQGKVIAWNKAIEEMTGIKASDMLGKSNYEYSLAFYGERRPILIDLALKPHEEIEAKYIMVERGDTVLTGKTYTPALKKEKACFVGRASVLRDSNGSIMGAIESIRDITETKKAEEELRRTNVEMAQLVASIPSFLIGLTPQRQITRWNRAAEKMFGISGDSVLGKPVDACGIQWELQKIAEAISLCRENEASVLVEDIRYLRPDGKKGFLCVTVNSIEGANDGPPGILLLGNDVTHRKILESQLVQAQKLESIGQLAAGIAHEINTPAQYVGDNARFLQEAHRDLEGVHDLYDQLLTELKSGNPTEDLVGKIEAVAEEVDLEYIRQEAPKAVQQSLDGIGRISTIVRAMKDFSHPGTEVKTNIDLNKAIESTITVARHEWKYVAEMVTDFDAGLPLVPCLPAEINQVILNIIINAGHAVADALKQNGSDQKGTITIGTRALGEHAEIRISDTGTGIPENIRSKIFDPFFTTKEVGKGTGQGLAISHSVVVDKHGGTITFDSEVGKGASFVIRLPFNQNGSEK